ncbi:MAG: hypothetical protein JWR34_2724, partial [Mycobacterium sp.]|nr:hypothetical protein [Mycobacterium sp.]
MTATPEVDATDTATISSPATGAV